MLLLQRQASVPTPKSQYPHMQPDLWESVTGTQTLQQCAEEALQQIQMRDYTAIIGQFSHIKTVLPVGMYFDGKEILCLRDL